jgi:hypothetical protein
VVETIERAGLWRAQTPQAAWRSGWSRHTRAPGPTRSPRPTTPSCSSGSAAPFSCAGAVGQPQDHDRRRSRMGRGPRGARVGRPMIPRVGIGYDVHPLVDGRPSMPRRDAARNARPRGSPDADALPRDRRRGLEARAGRPRGRTFPTATRAGRAEQPPRCSRRWPRWRSRAAMSSATSTRPC